MTDKRLVVRLSREEKQRLRELAEMENTSMTEVVKRIIDRAYERLGESGAEDHQTGSENVQEKPS
jgi:predicted DNA-binding protein